MLPRFPKLITYLFLLLLGGVFLGPLVTYATLTLDSTSITTDDTLKLKGGNVGVGNITPTSNLHVSGTLNVTATSTAAALSVSGASALTGALTLSNPSTNSLIYTNSTGVVTALASSTAGKILTASGTAPYFSWETTGSLANLTLTGPSTNSVIYTGSAGLITALASSTAGKVLMATSTAPYFSWETDATGGTVSTLVADANNEITVGSTTSALTVNIANVANTALQTINIGGASAATSTVNILSGTGTAGAGTLNLGNNPRVSTISLGNGDPSAALTINIGSGSTGATSTSINIGNGTAANTITLGAGTGGHTINIGTGTTTAKTINIGTANQVQNTITIGNASSSIALSGTLRITEGNQGAGKFLGSDASGNAQWQTPSSTTALGSFSVYRATSVQAITSANWTKVQFNAESWDVSGWFDSTTNYRFTPLKAGYYRFNGSINYTTSLGDQVRGGLALYKNGSNEKYLILTTQSGGDDVDHFIGSAVAQANGTTDYFELFAYQNAGTDRSLGAAAASTYFQGEFIGTTP